MGHRAAQSIAATGPALAVGIETSPPPVPDAGEEMLARMILLPATSEKRMQLDEIVRAVADAGHCSIWIDRRALRNAGIDMEQPVLLDSPLTEVSVREALDAIVGGLFADVPIGFEFENGAVVFSTRDELSKYTTTVVYNIRDILDAFTQYYGTMPSTPTRQECIDQVTKLLTDVIAPDTWRDAGGSVASMRELMGLLIITQTPENQREISKLLATFRQASRTKAPAEFRVDQTTLDRSARDIQ
jgi:hypothetical protein